MGSGGTVSGGVEEPARKARVPEAGGEGKGGSIKPAGRGADGRKF